MVPPLLYVVSRDSGRVNGWRFDANLWDPALPPAALHINAGGRRNYCAALRLANGPGARPARRLE
jgi:hypothetical protein